MGLKQMRIVLRVLLGPDANAIGRIARSGPSANALLNPFEAVQKLDQSQ
jgi:hypothetical protein